MKKFLIFIFTMFGLMLGMLAMIYNEYIRAYEAAHHRSSFPEPKENLLVPVSTRAYAKAKSWSEKSPLSKQQIKNYLTKYGRYSEYTSQSAVNKLNIDWKEQAVLRAKSYQKFHYSNNNFTIDLKNLKEADESKIATIESNEKWHNENKDTISIYDRYLNSDDYKTSPMKNIQDQLKTFLMDHHYYEVAIPLIRQFSKSYDHYYKKLTEASDYYLKQKGDAPQ